MDRDWLDLGAGAGLKYRYEAPSGDSGKTFVCFNPLTGDLDLWDGEIGPALRAAGHGTLLWNLPGQEGSPAPADAALDDVLFTRAAAALVEAVGPVHPVHVGLSIGGLFAARAWLAGVPAEALVLVNTLRRPGPRLAAINDAVFRCAQVGGQAMIKDLLGPLLFNAGWLEAHRSEFFVEARYEPLAPDLGAYRLLSDSRSIDWDLPYEALSLPVLVVSGLKDRVFYDPEDVADCAARLPEGRRVDVPDSGHMLPLERPRALIDALLHFASAIL
jgi:pimeloyl-ACP methyl ester carboxylesterase